MKNCPRCNKEYDDDKIFCTACGAQLVAPPAAPAPAPPASSVPSMPPAPADMPAKDSSWFDRWGGSLLAIVGIIICWNISASLGAILALIGMIFGLASANRANKVLSVIIGVFALVLFVLTIMT